MHLRKSLVAVAAALAVGLLGLSSSAYASTGTVSGYPSSGSVTFAGSTYSCTSGTVAGVYDNINNPALDLNSSTMIRCPASGPTMTISINSGCTVPVSLTAGRTAGTDTNITGTADFGTSGCVTVRNLLGSGTCYVEGTVNAIYDEITHSLTLNSPAGGNLMPSCLGAYASYAPLVLNNIVLNITPINFV
jgi:hypothetical protein